MRSNFFSVLLLIAALSLVAGIGKARAGEDDNLSHSDPVVLVKNSLEKMGGRSGWDHARVLKWNFMGKRLNYWDKFTGDVRIEADSTLILMNINT